MHIRPGEHFSLINKNRLGWSPEVLMRFYLPIVGRDALTLYQYLTTSDSTRVSDVLNHLNMSIVDFNQSVDRLTAMSLLDIYTDSRSYQFELLSPKNPADFLADEFYSRLLLSRVGEEAFKNLSARTEPLPKKLSKKFSEVFSVSFNGQIESLAESQDKRDFDITSFRNIMRQQGLKFADENADVLRIFEIADKYNYNWYELFKLVEKTIGADSLINLDALLHLVSEETVDQPDLDSFSPDERTLIQVAKTVNPDEFLAQLKNQTGGFVTTEERQILLSLSRAQVAPEVQNILVHYILIQAGRSSLTKSSAERIATEWKSMGISSAELAMKRIASFSREREERAAKGPVNRYESRPTDQTRSSAKVPDWHKESAEKTETPYTEEQLEKLRKLEEMRQNALKRKQEARD